MAGKKWAQQRDLNEGDIVKALQAIPQPSGCTAPMPRVTVQPVEGASPRKGSVLPSRGTPDLVVGCDGVTHIMEVKNMATDHTRTPQKTIRERFAGHLAKWGMMRCRHLLPHQHEWIDAWTGSPVAVVTNAQEAAAALGLCLRCGADEPTGLCSGCKTGDTT